MSLVAFSAGALIPLLPYLAGLSVLAAALGVAAVALLTLGMVVGRLTGRPMLRSGLRQLALGGVAVAVTFTVGALIAAAMSPDVTGQGRSSAPARATAARYQLNRR